MKALITRRSALSLFGSAILAPVVMPAFSQGVDGRKFIFILLRGGMDGLSALIPNDSETMRLRGSILPPKSERLAIGQGFDLHPALKSLHQLYHQGEASFIHAAATSYRSRSHFDGQDYLELLGPQGTKEGWLNRALQAVGSRALAVGYSIPLALQGRGRVTNWAPPKFSAASEDLLDRLMGLYDEDNLFAAQLASARSSVADMDDISDMEASHERGKNDVLLLEAAGTLMAAEGGPGVGMISLEGWDTHANQERLLARRMSDLSEGIASLKAALGEHWTQTAIVICSEFGRTVAANGTRGTDHGTGGLVTLMGGAVKGGRIFGDWPETNQKALFEGRDLAPANDVSGILKGVLRDHLGIDRSALDQDVLPQSGRAWDGLIKT